MHRSLPKSGNPDTRNRVRRCVLAASPWTAAGQTFSDTRFQSEVVANFAPFQLVGLRWAPDGRIFVLQKNGVIRIIKNGVVLTTPFLDFSAKVNTYDDRGMWGLAFHPSFAQNGYLYLTYVFEEAGNPNSSATMAGSVTKGRTPNVVRIEKAASHLGRSSVIGAVLNRVRQ